MTIMITMVPASETNMLSNLNWDDWNWNAWIHDCGCGMYSRAETYLQFADDRKKEEKLQKTNAQIRIQCTRCEIQAILQNVPMKLNEWRTN